MLTRFSEDCSFRPGHIDNRNSTVKGNTGEESLAGAIITLKVAVNNDSVGLSDVALIELYDLTIHCCIVTITSNCEYRNAIDCHG